jgi:hypothetical protein
MPATFEPRMVDCGCCGRIHENLPGFDCRAFATCPKCGDAYLTLKYGPFGADHLGPHQAVCNGTPEIDYLTLEEQDASE